MLYCPVAGGGMLAVLYCLVAGGGILAVLYCLVAGGGMLAVLNCLGAGGGMNNCAWVALILFTVPTIRQARHTSQLEEIEILSCFQIANKMGCCALNEANIRTDRCQWHKGWFRYEGRLQSIRFCPFVV